MAIKATKGRLNDNPDLLPRITRMLVKINPKIVSNLQNPDYIDENSIDIYFDQGVLKLRESNTGKVSAAFHAKSK